MDAGRSRGKKGEKKGPSRVEREGVGGEGVEGQERLEQRGRGTPRDVLMVLEIENAPSEPKWIWPPSLP